MSSLSMTVVVRSSRGCSGDSRLFVEFMLQYVLLHVYIFFKLWSVDVSLLFIFTLKGA
jgi:hypothetical protein